ncbi:MAG TPA: transcriptional regulator [Gammaproteobacteria bacterium]|nr:transcriptional regulator [Gammaproteobacteria bacterium]
MSNTALKTVFQDFAEVAAPYLHISDTAHYEEALALLEALMEDANDRADDPLNCVIDLVAHAVNRYERELAELGSFETQASDIPPDVAMLRVLMQQHGLGVADFPEIGDKSLLSRILSGSRNLTKQHIRKLSERFGISSSLFFEDG